MQLKSQQQIKEDENEEIQATAILSCILLNGKLLSKALAGGISSRGFKNHDDSELFDLMMTVQSEGLEPDFNNLISDKRVNVSHLLQIDGFVETTMQFERFLSNLVASISKEKLCRTLLELERGVRQGETSIDDVQGQINAFSKSRNSENKITTIKHNIENIIENIKNPKSEAEENKFSWGHEDTDKLCGEIRNGELIVIGARPSTGKTSLAMQMTAANIKKGKHVLFFSFETSAEELAEVHLNQELAVKRNTINDPFELKKVEEYAKEKFTENCHIVSQSCDVESIEGIIHSYITNNKCDIVVIDYLQLIMPTDRKMIREQQIAHISRKLRLLTIDTDIPICTLAQISRESEKDQRTPRMSDLRESGAIEQDASGIMMIYRPKDKFTGSTQDAEEGYDGEEFDTYLCQLKRKKGKKDVFVRTRFLGPRQTFLKAHEEY